ncbi:E3 ubiquitin-protein ligase HACE1-like isoform X2 [Mercenaria mercenaria]|uniref:E3 ubiquitin-protein ligase HACE1-like isoform X2 n=1 Tax=Mercenaria mercenaria TaxID=6596 RepID=UPI00234F1DFD|nr:E3 ubiquitin-protein ligase HACE1-like isoform X2 [Mercenaria mercenaria]
MMSFIQRLAKSLRSARTVELPEDAKSAFYMLMPMVIGNQHKSLSELLSSSKYDVNYQCGRAQRTLLHISANCGSYECLNLLIKKGADVNARDMSGCTPLHLAARNGQKKCLVSLLEHKANVKIRSNEGLTVLHWLAVNGRAEMLKDLFQYISDVDIGDAQGQTALHVACQNGHKSTVLCLLEHGADVNRPNNFGWTPLHFACSNGQHDTANFLLMKGAKISTVSTPVCGEEEDIAGGRQGGSDRTHTKTPLELCVEGGYSETCDILIRHWPKLFPHLISMVANKNINEAMVLKVLKYLCVHNDLDLTVKVFSALAHDATNIGHSVLSMSTDAESQVLCLLRCVKILTQLYSKLIRHYSNNNIISADQAENVLLKTFQPLELLWQLMEEWLSIVKEEVQCSKTANGSQRNAKSAPPDLQVASEQTGAGTLSEDQAVNQAVNSVHVKNSSKGATMDNPSLHLCTESAAGKDSAVRRRKQLSVDGHDLDVLEVMVPRLCGVIHAYYLVCTCDSGSTEDTSARFVQFVGDNEALLMSLVERKPTMIFDHFHFLLDVPEMMTVFLPIVRKQPFESRRNWFYEKLSKDLEVETPGSDNSPQPLMEEEEEALLITRDALFQSSCSQILKKSPDRLKRMLNLRFDGEEGMGQGVVREWFDVLSKEILNPDYALFTQSADGSTFQPNSNSSVNPDHLNYFRFAGQCLGLALYHKQLINAYFTRSFYKHILGIPVNYTDVVSIDPEYAKNLQWILDHDITDLGLDLTFSVETDVFGYMEEMDLKPGGSKIPVTEKNKAEYVQLVTELRMTRAIQPQIDSFLSGFHAYIPRKLVRLFDEYELELLLSGIPEIDIQDWKDNTTYIDCTTESKAVKWFWEILKEFTEQEKVLMLQFVTGSSRLPFGGFSKLTGGGGPQKFSISLVPYTQDLLPTASTCINFLRLPDYPSKALTKEKILVALQCGSQGYALA